MATEKIVEKQEKLLFVKDLIENRQFGDAWKLLDKILEETPNDIPALISATTLHDRTRAYSIAYQLARRAAELGPNIHSVWVNLGKAAESVYQLEESKMAYEKAIKMATKPDQLYQDYNNMASLSVMMGNWSDGEAYARLALTMQDGWKAKANLGIACLGQQKWEEGWKNYDYVRGTEQVKLIKYRDEPLWDGSAGKTVIVYGEQGLGDELSFASMIPDALKVCKKVIIDCDVRLAPIFKRSFPQASVYGTRWEKGRHWDVDWKEEDKSFDASISIGHLGQFCRVKNEDFPGRPYLVPDQDRYVMWREFFKTKPKPVIGIAWTGGVQWTAAKFRKWGLEEVAPMIDAVPNAHWVCLQYKDATDEIEKSGLPINQYKFATLSKDYDDTAALVAACDLIICMQTSVGHLAGALGKEVWCFVNPLSQWRYGGDSDKILWYDSMKVFRTTNWKWPIQEAANVLKLRYG